MNIEQTPLFPECAVQRPPPPRGSKVVVSYSTGKDSLATLLVAIETYGREQVIAHHQVIVEDWPDTIPYGQRVCARLGIPWYQSQGHYHGYECLNCQNHYLTASNTPYCLQCHCREATYIAVVESVLDLVEWRRMWPSLSARFCTAYFKREVFNRWARRNRDLLGDAPVLIMGERWRESKGRARLPYLRQRSGLSHITEYRPILDWRRMEVFRKAEEYGIEQHYCYEAQGLTKWQMLHDDVEGGPRMSCVMCFLKTEEQMQASYQAPQGRPTIERGLRIEQETGHTITRDRSLRDMVHS